MTCSRKAVLEPGTSRGSLPKPSAQETQLRRVDVATCEFWDDWLLARRLKGVEKDTSESAGWSLVGPGSPRHCSSTCRKPFALGCNARVPSPEQPTALGKAEQGPWEKARWPWSARILLKALENTEMEGALLELQNHSEGHLVSFLFP